MVSIFEQIDVLRQYEDVDDAATAGSAACKNSNNDEKKNEKRKGKKLAATTNAGLPLPWDGLRVSGHTRMRSNSDAPAYSTAANTAAKAKAKSAANSKKPNSLAKKRGTAPPALMDWGDMLSRSPSEVFSDEEDGTASPDVRQAKLKKSALSPRAGVARTRTVDPRRAKSSSGNGTNAASKRVESVKRAATSDEDTSDVHSDFIRTVLEQQKRHPQGQHGTDGDGTDGKPPRWLAVPPSPRSSR